MRDPLHHNGQPIPGTALHRLQSAIADSPECTVMAGDVLDVVAAADESDKVVSALKKTAADEISKEKRYGASLWVKAADLQALIVSATKPVPEPDAKPSAKS